MAAGIAPALIQGRIVYPTVPVPDPQGRNPKPDRPFVVISSNEDIQAAKPIVAVGITTELNSSPTNQLVPVAWGPTARTGLRRESAAHCTWIYEFTANQVRVDKGFVGARTVTAIVERVAELKSESSS